LGAKGGFGVRCKALQALFGVTWLSGGVMAGISTNSRHSVTNVKKWISGVILD